jgi:hypothetical protein
VNLVAAFVTVLVLVLYISYFYQVFFVFSLLWIYRYFRKNSIQFIDVALFSLGAGSFSFEFLPVYCLLTAMALIVISWFSQGDKLPFMVAWVIGFWGTYSLK